MAVSIPVDGGGTVLGSPFPLDGSWFYRHDGLKTDAGLMWLCGCYSSGAALRSSRGAEAVVCERWLNGNEYEVDCFLRKGEVVR